MAQAGLGLTACERKNAVKWSFGGDAVNSCRLRFFELNRTLYYWVRGGSTRLYIIQDRYMQVQVPYYLHYPLDNFS